MRTAGGLVAFALSLLCACFAPAVPRTLGWTPASLATTTEGRVAVAAVTNRRPVDRGGRDTSLVGYWRNELEERTPLRTDEATGPLQLSVRGLVSDALRSAGIAVTSVDDATATALVNVDVLELWTDGGPSIPRGRVVLDLIVLDPVTHAERLRVSVEGQGDVGAPRIASLPRCQREITNAACAYFVLPMTDAYRSIMSAMERPEIRAAVLGTTAP